MTAIHVVIDTSSSISNEEIERMRKDDPWMLWATHNVCRDAQMNWMLRPEWQMRKPVRSRKSARKMRRKHSIKG